METVGYLWIIWYVLILPACLHQVASYNYITARLLFGQEIFCMLRWTSHNIVLPNCKQKCKTMITVACGDGNSTNTSYSMRSDICS